MFTVFFTVLVLRRTAFFTRTRGSYLFLSARFRARLALSRCFLLAARFRFTFRYTGTLSTAPPPNRATGSEIEVNAITSATPNTVVAMVVTVRFGGVGCRPNSAPLAGRLRGLRLRSLVRHG